MGRKGVSCQLCSDNILFIKLLLAYDRIITALSVYAPQSGLDHSIKSSQHLLVQSQQSKHQNTV